MQSAMSNTANRLRQARERAGYENARVASERFGWTYSTYVGHENGNRGMKASTLGEYARAFKVDLRWLMTGQGAISTEKTSSGFAEDAPGFDPHPIVESSNIRAMLALLVPEARHPVAWSIRSAIRSSDLRSGDVLLVDANCPPDEGALCLVNWTNDGNEEPRTLVRRHSNGVFVQIEDDDAPIIIGLNSSGTVMPVLAVVRGGFVGPRP